MLTQERLKELLYYDPDTGSFYWISARPRCTVGALAGSLDKTRGYYRVWIDGKNHKGHRLAWLYTYGVFPTHHVDHINGDKSDNRIANLREVTHAENLQNQHRAQKGSRSGVLGVYPRKNGKWRAMIQLDGRTRHLGTFDSIRGASAAYLAAKRELHPFGDIAK